MHKTGTKKQNALGAASRETALSRCFNKTNSDKKKTTFKPSFFCLFNAKKYAVSNLLNMPCVTKLTCL